MSGDETILAIETSGRRGSLALRRDGRPLMERPMQESGRRHAQTLVADVMALLQDAEIAPRAVDALAVSVGPGSFTGLRVGVVFAKTWAYATGCRLIAVDTLEAAARNSPNDVASVWMSSDAQRHDLYVGHYRREGDQPGFRREGDIAVRSIDEWLAELRPGETISGPGADKLEAARLQSLGLRILEPIQRHPTAAQVAEIAEGHLRRAEFADPWALEPFYFRKAAAEEVWDNAGRP